MQTTRRSAPRTPTTVRRGLTALWMLTALLATSACGPRTPGSGDGGSSTAGPPATNQQLEITLGQVPPGFRVLRNEGDELVLERSDPEDPGTLEVIVGPPQSAGINLKEQVWAEKARIESMPAGDYRGQNELAGAAIGAVYTSRGRFTGENGEPIEEYRALAVHPASRQNAHRLLILDYEYPPTEKTGERLNHLMQVIETIRAAGNGGGN